MTRSQRYGALGVISGSTVGCFGWMMFHGIAEPNPALGAVGVAACVVGILVPRKLLSVRTQRVNAILAVSALWCVTVSLLVLVPMLGYGAYRQPVNPAWSMPLVTSRADCRFAVLVLGAIAVSGFALMIRDILARPHPEALITDRDECSDRRM